MRSESFGGGFSDLAIDGMQRRFPIEVTPRVHVPDPLARYNLRYTADCPCDPCILKKQCKAECDNFHRWVMRNHPKDLARRRAREAVYRQKAREAKCQN